MRLKASWPTNALQYPRSVHNTNAICWWYDETYGMMHAIVDEKSKAKAQMAIKKHWNVKSNLVVNDDDINIDFPRHPIKMKV